MKYYVIKNKETNLYFRGKGANRWGKYYNQASIYRSEAAAMDTLTYLSSHGENVELVTIQITEVNDNSSSLLDLPRYTPPTQNERYSGYESSSGWDAFCRGY